MSADQALLLAVRAGQLPAVKRASARGKLDRNLRDPYGATCLHLAARSGRLELARFLVEEAGHSTIAAAQNGALPSHDSAAAGHRDCLDYLLRWGCPDQARDNSGATVLHLSARFGHVHVLRYLVEVRGLSIRDKDRKGVGVLHYAAAKGDLSCLMYILATVPDLVNDRAESGATPAYFAVQNGHLSCLQHLVTAAGANVHLRANDGMQPIHAAAQTGQLHCLTWLVQDQGVLLMERDNDGATPLHFAASRGHAGVVRWLLDNGAVCERDHLGGTPLHDAAEHGQLECAKILVEHGCDVNSEDKDFLVASDLAKKCGHFQVAKFLRSIEKRTGKAKGKGQSGHAPSAHEVGVYVKRSVSSPTDTGSSLSSSSSAPSEHDSVSSVGTIEREFVDRPGRYRVIDSPELSPDPQYVQIYEKLTDVGPTAGRVNGPRATQENATSPEGEEGRNGTEELSSPDEARDVCSQGTQTECVQPKEDTGVETCVENGAENGAESGAENDAENGKSQWEPKHEGDATTPPVASPQKSLRRQSATEPSAISSPHREAWIETSRSAAAERPAALAKPSPEKKALRFSTTVMVEEIGQQQEEEEEEGSLGLSPTKRSVQLIPLNPSSETGTHSPPPRRTSSCDAPSPPSITSAPPRYLPAVPPGRPATVVIPPPPMLASPPASLRNGAGDSDRSREVVSSRLSFITSAVPSPPSPPPPSPPQFTNGLRQHSPTAGPSPQSAPSAPGPPLPSDLASVVLKPVPQNSRPSSSNSSVGGKPTGFSTDLLAEIQAGPHLRHTGQNQSRFLRDSPSRRSPAPTSNAGPAGSGPRAFYALDFLDSVPLVDDSGAELPDWRRRFLAKKAADRANQRAAMEYRQQREQRAEERKYRDMPPWKVELLKKKEARGVGDTSRPNGVTSSGTSNGWK